MLTQLANQFPSNEFYRKRGYKYPLKPIDLLVRWWLVSFAQPGFHRFWRVWNPLLNYLLFLFYVALGGNKRPFIAGFLVFTGCGFVFHDLLSLNKGLELDMTISFMIWAVLCDLSRRFKLHEIQSRWPWVVNVVVNVLLLVAGRELGKFLWMLLVS